MAAHKPGGGSSQPVGKAKYYGTDTAVPPNTLTPLNLSGTHTGDNLLSLTDPANPTIVTAGWYTFTAAAYANEEFSAGKFYAMELRLAVPTDDVNLTEGKTTSAAFTYPSAQATLTWELAAGQIINVSSYHDDIDTRDVLAIAWIVQLA
jgi:hypothetical protein